MELFDRIKKCEFDGPVRPSRMNAEQSAAYNAAVKGVREAFKLALEATYLPPRTDARRPNDRVCERMFEMAWEQGRANGLIDIATYYEELVALVEMR